MRSFEKTARRAAIASIAISVTLSSVKIAGVLIVFSSFRRERAVDERRGRVEAIGIGQMEEREVLPQGRRPIGAVRPCPSESGPEPVISARIFVEGIPPSERQFPRPCAVWIQGGRGLQFAKLEFQRQQVRVTLEGVE